MEVVSDWRLESENERKCEKVGHNSVAIPPCKVYVIAFRIPHYVSSGPVGAEVRYEVYGLFKLVAGCYV